MADYTGVVTFVRRPDTGILYFSDQVWNHPPTAVVERPTKWLLVPMVMAEMLAETLGRDVLPRHAGEYVMIRDGEVV